MPEPGGTVLPQSAVEWTLTNQRRNETRTFTQTELSIEGEARLLSLVREIGLVLREEQVDWGRLNAMLDEGATIEWEYLLDILALIAEKSVDLVTNTALVFFGIFPTDEGGQPNRDYEDHRLFVRGAINIPKWADMVQTFLLQNDYRRLAGPFGRALNIVMPQQQAIATAPTATSPEPSTSSSPPDTSAATPDASPDATAGASSIGM